MNSLVTGSTGFLGSWIVKLLLERGDRVRVLVRRDVPDLAEMGVEIIHCDLSETDKVSRAMEGIDCVYHAAARPGIWGSAEDYFRDNVLATRNIIEGCRLHEVPKLVFTSSPSVVIGDEDLEGVDESIPYAKSYLAQYPRTKAIAEREVLEANDHRLMTCALRPHLIWGPGDRHLIPRFLLRGKQGRLRIVGSGNNKVDTIYIEDAARAHLVAEEKLSKDSAVCGNVFFLSQEEPVVMFDWINRILSASGIPPVTKKIPAKLAYLVGFALEGIYTLFPMESEPPMTRFVARQLSQSHYFDHKKAREILGFTPRYSMEEAYQKTFESDYFRKLCQDIRV